MWILKGKDVNIVGSSHPAVSYIKSPSCRYFQVEFVCESPILSTFPDESQQKYTKTYLYLGKLLSWETNSWLHENDQSFPPPFFRHRSLATLRLDVLSPSSEELVNVDVPNHYLNISRCLTVLSFWRPVLHWQFKGRFLSMGVEKGQKKWNELRCYLASKWNDCKIFKAPTPNFVCFVSEIPRAWGRPQKSCWQLSSLDACRVIWKT